MYGGNELYARPGSVLCQTLVKFMPGIIGHVVSHRRGSFPATLAT